MHYYFVRHLTKFIYGRPVSESVMEVRMHPRGDSHQRCLSFMLSLSPRCRVFTYRDHLGNHIHHFDIPGRHDQLVIVAESVLEHHPLSEIPEELAPDAWQELDVLVAEGDYWEMLLPSEFAQPTPALLTLAEELGVVRRDDPLKLLREINTRLYEVFSYAPQTTQVDSPIDQALHRRQGVCQDFAHIMIAMVRQLGIPCRYVSGYLFHGRDNHDRSTADATHAWVEAFLPTLGWVGFDPTNALIAGDRHIRTALGRDYADVPPTRGLFRGRTDSELHVAVKVTASAAVPDLDRELPIPEDWSMLVERATAPPPPAEPLLQIQQSQQQQQ